MTSLQMDAVSSFVYLTDHVPSWLTQLTNVSKYAAQKNSDFVDEYTKLVNKVKPNRIKSPSLQSNHSDKSRSAGIPDVDPRHDTSLPAPPDPVDIDPTYDGNKYLYAQAQRKRKPTSSVRSGASGPQKFRSRNQVVVYYDSHVQSELDSMVKAIGLARNNLRKGRNAHNASQGFSLPTLGRKYDMSFSPSLDNIRTNAMARSSPLIPGSKQTPRSPSQQPSKGGDAFFTSADKTLEAVQALYETAAHQFLRDGDCRTELDSALTQLKAVLVEAQHAVENLREKAEKQQEESVQADSDAADTASDISQQTPPINFDPLQMISNKYGPTTLSQTLEEMKNRPMLNAPAVGDVSNLPTAGVEIEVDDDASDDESISEIDMSQFRSVNRPWLARAAGKSALRTLKED